MLPQNPNRLLGTTSMTPIERSMGRFMRAPDHPDGNDSNQQENNTGGNNNPPSEDSNTQNNSGDDFDPVAFFSDGGGGDETPPSQSGSAGNSPPPPPPPSNTEPNVDKEFADKLFSEIDALPFEGVFSDDVTEAINKGDYKGANEAITKNLRGAVRQSTIANAKLLRKFGEAQTNSIMERVRGMIDERVTGEKATDALVSAIPAASNPKVAPVIRAIYDQALLKSKGNVAEAVSVTKRMMATMTSEIAAESGFDVAPADPHSNRSTPPRTNWLEELTKV